jgi:hypothetical protein
VSTVTVYELKLPVGVVKIREMSVGDFEAALRFSKDSGQGTGADWELTNECLRRSVVEIGGKPVAYGDLADQGLAARLGGLKGLMLARAAWNKIHSPSAEEAAAVGEMKVTVQAT